MRGMAWQAILACRHSMPNQLNKGIVPHGESLWEQRFQEDAADTVTLTAPTDGRYTVHVEGDSTGGSYDLSWSSGE